MLNDNISWDQAKKEEERKKKKGGRKKEEKDQNYSNKFHTFVGRTIKQLDRRYQ